MAPPPSDAESLDASAALVTAISPMGAAAVGGERPPLATLGRDGRRMGETVEVAKLVGAIVERAGRFLKRKIDAVLVDWPRIMGPEHGRRTRAVKVYKGQLTVRVADPTWLTQYRFIEAAFRKRINDAMGYEAVKEIRFVQGTLEDLPSADDPAVSSPARPRRTSPPPPTFAERRRLRDALAAVADSPLRTSIEKVMRAHLGPLEDPT